MKINWEDFINTTIPIGGVEIYISDIDKYFKSVNGQWVEIPKSETKREVDKAWLNELPEFLKRQAD